MLVHDQFSEPVGRAHAGRCTPGTDRAAGATRRAAHRGRRVLGVVLWLTAPEVDQSVRSEGPGAELWFVLEEPGPWVPYRLGCSRTLCTRCGTAEGEQLAVDEYPVSGRDRRVPTA